MSAALGTLSVDLVLNGDGTFTTNIKKVDGSIKSLYDRATGATTSINDLSAALTRATASPFAATIGKLSASVDGLRSSNASMARESQRATDQLAAMQRQADATAQSVQRAVKAMQAAASATQTAAQPIRAPSGSAPPISLGTARPERSYGPFWCAGIRIVALVTVRLCRRSGRDYIWTRRFGCQRRIGGSWD